VNVPAVGAPIAITANRCPAEQGRMPPSLARHRHRPGEFLLCVGLCLLRMRRPLSYKGSSLLGRGSWIAMNVPSSHGRKGWRPLHTRLGGCAWNVTLVAPVPMSSSGTSSPKRAPPVPGLKSSPTFAGHQRNSRFFFACRRQTRRCGRRYWQRSLSTARIPVMGGTYR
jgi:hypothetical protein